MATTIPPDEILGYYASGWFPMADPDGILRIYSPDPRGILPLESFHIPHGARKAVSDPAWEIRCDTCFDRVLAACARRKETWIDSRIARSYHLLHQAGHAHSIEVFREDRLVGGLYGVRLGAAFFGESMFHRSSGASKAALAFLVTQLRKGGFELLDTQWNTPHLARFGAIEIPRTQYLAKLRRAIKKKADWPA
jgi:leucyl/phenylalanyl-tRNA---protein transferase